MEDTQHEESVSTDVQMQQNESIPQIRDLEKTKDTIKAMFDGIIDYKFDEDQIRDIVTYLFRSEPEERLKYVKWIIDGQDAILRQ